MLLNALESEILFNNIIYYFIKQQYLKKVPISASYLTKVPGGKRTL